MRERRAMVTKTDGAYAGEPSENGQEPDLSQLPPKIQRFFKDRNLNLVIDSYRESSMVTKSLIGQHPIHIDEDFPQDPEERAELLREARQFNYRVHPSDQTLRMGDCLLAIQSEGARLKAAAEAAGRWALQSDPDYSRKKLENAARDFPHLSRGAVNMPFDELPPQLRELVNNE